MPRSPESIDPVRHLRGELYQVLAESAPDAIIAMDENSVVLSVNPAVERLFGYAAHEIVGQPLSLLMPERMRGAHHAGVARYVSTGVRHIPWQNIRVPILTRAGTEIPVEISFGEFVADGRRFFSGFLRDVSERVAAEHALNQARAESEVRATDAEHLAIQLQEQAIELEHQTEEAQALAEELEQANGDLQEAVLRAELAGAETAATLDTLSGTVEELRRSEERYRALVEASTLMVWLTDENGLVEDMPFWRELTGQSLDEVRGNGWANAIHPDDRSRTFERWQRARATRGVHESEYRLRLTNGTYRWYRARGVPVVDQSGAVREWVGVFNDIDEAVRREAGTRFLADAGVALAESLGERGTLDTVAQLAIEGLADGCMITLVNDDGSFEHVATESRTPEIAELVIDTERKYPLLADATSGHPRAIRTGLPQLLPERAFDATALPAIAHNTDHLERLQRIGMYSGMIVPLTARGRTLGAITLVLHGPGRRTPFDQHDLGIASELGRRAGLAIDNARAYEAERVAREAAEFANRARSDFLATMSHELRTPLNAIAGYVELMELGLRGPVTEQQLQDLTRIRKSQERLLRLVNDVLSFAKIDAGQVSYDIADVALDEVIAGVEALVLPQLTAKALAYTFNSATCTLPVHVDRERLEQILLNLVSNAIKFTAAGGMVTVTCESRKDSASIHVSDTGIGIPEEKIDAIFDPFVQVETGHTRSAEGTGLGLAISRELAAGMGVTVTVRSEVGVGSTFTVTIPVSGSPAAG
ncbi:MAG: PAS domain S-box protein [Gemmatimonadaceae bacterium]